MMACVTRSEEHTSELQSRSDLVCRLLLEKKKTAIARATMRARRAEGYDAPLAVLPADHYITDAAKYDTIVRATLEAAPDPVRMPGRLAAHGRRHPLLLASMLRYVLLYVIFFARARTRRSLGPQLLVLLP